MTVKKDFQQRSDRSFRSKKIEIRQADNSDGASGPGMLFGVAVPWDTLTDEDALPWFREQFRKGAFTETLKNDEQKAYWMHDKTWLLGSRNAGTLRLEERDEGLYFEIDLPDTNAGRDVAVSVGRGDIDGVSFGFYAERSEWDETDPDNEIRTVLQAKLYEISPEPFPAYTESSISSRSAKNDYDEYKKEKQIREKEKDNKCDNSFSFESRSRLLYLDEQEDIL